MKYIFKISILLIVAAIYSSCEYLEYDEASYNTKQDVFTDFERTKKFLTGVYTYLPDDFNSIDGAMRESATDNAEHVWDLSNIQRFNNGSWSAIQPLDNIWANMYSGIRAANLFLKETEGKIYDDLRWNDEYSEIIEQFDMYPYEARFLRALYYFELIKRYKNVPLITKVLTPEEANTVSQASFDDVVNFIVDECNATAKVLPVDHNDFSSVSETGRATRGAAMALKARVLLYAASPLHNTENDITKWQLAARAAKDLIDSAWYSLEANYANVVNNAISPELIFGTRQAESNLFERNNFPVGYEGGNTGTCPTQNLVDAYEMVETGLPITDTESGYNELFPYNNRDPRLAQTVILNNSIWKGKVVSSFYGGTNGAPKAGATKTGYYLKKYVIESINLEPNNTTRKNHVWVLFRYAEVLLNYAEAMNEAYSPEDAADLGLTATEAVNIVRSRAGMPPFESGMSADDFRTKLRNERRVELAFEDHRFWDIRRWKIGTQTTEIYGTNITTNPYGGFMYETFLIDTNFEPNTFIGPGKDDLVDPNEIDNLLPNGNFETGDLVPWAGYAHQLENTDPFEGDFAGRLNRGNSAFNQVLTNLTAGTTYNVSFTAKFVGEPAVIKMAFKDNQNLSEPAYTTTDPVTSSEWTTIVGEMTVPEGVTEVKVIFWKGDGTSPCIIDNVSIAEKN